MTPLRLVLLLGIVVTTVSTATPTVPLGRLQLVAGGRVVWSAPIHAGEPFDVTFRHSQERVRWIQHYEAGSGAVIWQRGSTFPSYGAGMPLGRVTRTSNGFRVAAESRLEAIRMLNSRDAALTLQHRETTLPIGQWFADFEHFEIRVR